MHPYPIFMFLYRSLALSLYHRYAGVEGGNDCLHCQSIDFSRLENSAAKIPYWQDCWILAIFVLQLPNWISHRKRDSILLDCLLVYDLYRPAHCTYREAWRGLIKMITITC